MPPRHVRNLNRRKDRARKNKPSSRRTMRTESKKQIFRANDLLSVGHEKQIFRANALNSLSEIENLVVEEGGGKKTFRADKRYKVLSKITQASQQSEKKGLGAKIFQSKFVMKLLHNRAGQIVSALTGLVIGKLITSGFLEQIQANEPLRQFLIDIGINPTEAGIMGLISGLFWALYNLAMTMVYGAKFRDIQIAHGLEPDRWAGPKTMAAAIETKNNK